MSFLHRVLTAQSVFTLAPGILPPGNPEQPPANVAPPTVTPDPVVEGALATSTTGTWTNTPSSFAFQWRRGGSPIGGAIAATYETTQEDVDAGPGALSCAVTASNAAGSGTPSVSNSVTVEEAPVGEGPFHGLVDFLEANTTNYYTVAGAAALDPPAGAWAVGIFTQLNDNAGVAYQYLLSMEAADGSPRFHLLLGEAGASVSAGLWGFNLVDDAGVATGSVHGGSSEIPDPADGVERLLVLQSTGSAVELWACQAAGGATAVKIAEAATALGPLTSSAEPTTWYLGRRSDGDTGRYYEEQAGGLFKADAALTQTQIEQIAGGSDPEAVLSGSIAVHFPFLSGAGATETDVVSGLTANRVGTFEVPTGSLTAITSRNPTLYVRGDGLSDSSGNGLTVTDQGGTILFGQSMARGTGMRLNGSHLQVANTSAHWSVDNGATDVDVQCEFGAGMDCIVPTLANNLVLMSMEDDEAIHRHGWTIWTHADGSVELQVRQPWQPARMRSPNGVVSAGVQFHVQMVLGRDGMMLYVDGRRMENGIKNTLVWHGIDRRERNTQSRNNSAFRVGATGSSPRSDIIVGHVFAFVRNGHSNELLDADCQAIAGASGSPHVHRVWGRAAGQTTRSPGTNVLQAAIDSLSNDGGGRLLLTPAGTFTQSVDLNLKANVEIVGHGSGSDPASNTIIQLTNDAQITTVKPNVNTFSAFSGTLAQTAKTLTASGHGLGADDVLAVIGNQSFHLLYSLDGHTTNDNEMCSELMPVERIVDANTIRIDRKPQFTYTAAQREIIGRFSPITDVGLRNLRIQRTHSGNGTNAQLNIAVMKVYGIRRFRLSNVHVRENYTGIHPVCFQPTECVDLWTDPESPCTFRCLGDFQIGGWQPYNVQNICCRGAVYHSCTLHGGQWHAVDTVSDNFFNEWPGTASSSRFVLSGHVCVVGCTVTGGPNGQPNLLNSHGGIKHYRFFNNTMPDGGGFGFGGGYGDIVDIQASNGHYGPHMSHTYGAWRCYAYKCNHQDPAGATGWIYAYGQAGGKMSMVGTVLSNVTKISTGANNSGGSLFSGNTLRNVTVPHPTTGMGGSAAAPSDTMG